MMMTRSSQKRANSIECERVKRQKRNVSLDITCVFGDIFNHVVAQFCSRRDLAIMRCCSNNTKDALLQACIASDYVTFDVIFTWDTKRLNLVRRLIVKSSDEFMQLLMVPNVREIAICEEVTEQIPLHLYPKGLKILSIFNNINQGTFPSTLKELEFYLSYNQMLLPGTLPSKLECLRFSGDFNQEKKCFQTPLFT